MTSSNINFSHLALTPQQILKAAPFIGKSTDPNHPISIPNSDLDSSTLTLDPRDLSDRTSSARFGPQSTIFSSKNAPTAQQIADSTEDLVAQILSSTINTSVGDNPSDISDFMNGVSPKLGVPYSSLFGEDSPSALGILVDADIIGHAITGSKSLFVEDKTFINQHLAPFVSYNDDVLQELVTEVPTAGMRNLLNQDTLSESISRLGLSSDKDESANELSNFESALSSSGLLSNDNLSSVAGQQKISDLIAKLGEVPSQDLIDQVYPNGVPGQTDKKSSSNNSQNVSAASALLAQSSQKEQQMLKQALQLFGHELPDVIPSNVDGGALQFILDFMALSPQERSKVRSALSVDTELDPDVQNNWTDTDSTIEDPFTKGLINSAGNPLLNLLTKGWLVPQGFKNGVVQSDSNAADTIYGLANARNVVDGQGNHDNIYLGQQDDLAKAYAGDWVFARGGDDTIFSTAGTSSGSRAGFLDGGAGDDRLVIAMDNPSNNSYRLTPLATKLGNIVHVLLNNGQQFITRAIESIVITDKEGDVFKRHTVNQLSEGQ